MKLVKHLFIITETILLLVCVFVALLSIVAIAHGAWWYVIFTLGFGYLATVFAEDLNKTLDHESENSEYT